MGNKQKEEKAKQDLEEMRKLIEESKAPVKDAQEELLKNTGNDALSALTSIGGNIEEGSDEESDESDDEDYDVTIPAIYSDLIERQIRNCSEMVQNINSSEKVIIILFLFIFLSIIL